MISTFGLSGKTILITGASSGIGKQTAIIASHMGADVIITGRDKQRLDETYSQLAQGNHKAIPADLKNQQELERLIADLPKLNGFVVSSGTIKTVPFNFINLNDMRDLMEINYEIPVLMTKMLLSKRILQNNSSIVFISSIGGTVIGTIGNALYSGSKGALSGIAKVIALENASKGIRVNCVAPGMVRTPLLKKMNISEEQLQEDEKQYPLGYGNPEDVANACIFLLSDASRWITGINLIVDGGFSIR